MFVTVGQVEAEKTNDVNLLSKRVIFRASKCAKSQTNDRVSFLRDRPQAVEAILFMNVKHGVFEFTLPESVFNLSVLASNADCGIPC